MKEKKAKKNQTTVRMNLLFVSVFFLFSMLILRLGVVQIVKGSQYEAEVSRTENVKSDNGNPPRGKIYDRYRNVIVDNVPMNAITYTSTQSTKSKEMLEVAENLSKLIDIDEKVIESINPRDKQDYWLLRNKEKAAELVTKDELAKLEADEGMNEDERNKKVYEMQLDRIPKDELKAISKQELKVLAIFRQFNTGYALTPKIVKNKNVSDEEMARVSENLSSLPGVNVTTDWERKYVQDSTLRSILGKVSTTEQGIPTELVDDFKSKGYAMNDRVGTSYFESEYESLLKGKKEEIEHITKNGSVIDSQMIKEGHSGKDVYLTIDLKLQKELEKIVEEELSKQATKRWESPYLDRAYLIMMNPYTGEILSMVGKKYGHDKDGNVELQDDALGTFTSEYGVGSAVKGATVLTGYMTDSLAIGEPLLDEAIQIKDTPVKRSWFNQSRGAMYMTDKQALEWSSNAYMWKTAFKVAGVTYQKDQPMNIKRETFDTFRNHFKQFGLGVKTEIDLPGEADGLQGSEYKPGNLMDFAIGQYDTYTPMQLAQYVSTIANGGYRMQPHIMKEIREPNYESEKVGSLLYEHESKVLNRLDASEEEIHSVQQGFYRVAHGANGTANNFANAPYDAAAKSGTAEAFYYAPERGKNLETYNTTLVGYAPYSHPEVSFAVVLPASHQDKDPYVNKTIAKRAMDKYFELKKEYEKKGYYSESTDKEVIETEE
ncbi:penicillin-binding protein 2 [Rossellomorea marisflavi]|uniref:peptidoglycan D,D-transpeptidase FtsI family protein n=1 Tax=Rossellomorea marisflavi TaxID=189381 RepID=UPI00207A4460|nr:penicillin-binding protein 2 [Rossellomorea marisflavi]USK90243.1 penicillin-binding protein 2 [Rossellomorea marisflavi]